MQLLICSPFINFFQITEQDNILDINMTEAASEASMRPTKNPGKLNTSFWESKNNDGADSKPKSAPKRHKKKKSKGKMASMWETKLAKQRQEVEATSFPKPSAAASSPPTAPAPYLRSTGSNERASTENADPNRSPNGAKSKTAALSQSLALNPLALRGGVPPSLRKKNEERKENNTELPGTDFDRPLIPSTARRPKETSKRDIVSVTNDEIGQRLREYLSASFQYDPAMIMDEAVLCVHLRDIGGIDLSAMGDVKWDFETLLEAMTDVFGVRAINTWGYTLRLI